MKKVCIVLSENDVRLIRTLLNMHRDLAISKRRLYEICDSDGSYCRTLSEYKKLISRYNCLLSIFYVSPSCKD